MEIKLKKALFLPGIRHLMIKLMKIFVLLFGMTVFGMSPNIAISQNSKIKIKSEVNLTIDEVFDLIISQTECNFIYEEGIFNNYPKVQLHPGIIRADDLLKITLEKSGFSYDFLANNTIAIAKRRLDLKKSQELEVKGLVTDNKGVPLSGITIFVTDKEPSGGVDSSTDFFIRGTATDFDGNFTIKAEAGNYLVATGIGYNYYTQKITAEQTNLKIVLKEKASELDEVVLIGYGSTTRKEITSSVSSVSSKELSKTIVGAPGSFDSGLAGLMKGVNIKQTSGQPGANIDINIRGFTSPFSGGDNNPLFVIDGVPFQANEFTSGADETNFASVSNPLTGINPNDIESVDVLKDAAATSIYGSRGANGVIIVKTKNGKRNQKANISFSTTTSFAQPTGLYDWLSASEQREFADVMLRNTVEAANLASSNGDVGAVFGLNGYSDIANIDVDFATFTANYNGLNDDYFGTADTDWNEEVYRNVAVSQEYNFAINGGSENTNYFFSTRYLEQEGLINEEERKQYGLRFGLDTDLSKIISVGTNVNLSYSKNLNGHNSFSNESLNARPDVSPYDENGNLVKSPSSFFGFPSLAANPVAVNTKNRNQDLAYNILGNVYMQLKPVKNVKIRAELNGSQFITNSRAFVPESVVGTDVPFFGIFATPENSMLTKSLVSNSNLTTDLTANYGNSFGKHRLDVLVGLSWNRTVSDRDYTLWQGFPDDFVLTTASSANRDLAKASRVVESGLNSKMARVSYNYDSRYYLTASLRTDKSSKFGPGNKVATFPALSASWNIGNEEFVSNSKIINNLKLRGSVGLTGSTNVADFAFIQFFETGFRSGALYNNQSAVGLSTTLPNPNIGWEETKEYNVGLDFGFLNNRLRGSLDIYDRETNGVLSQAPFPIEGGFIEFTDNFADLTNKGFELELAGDIIATDDFKWSASFNISKNKNVVTKLPDGLEVSGLLDVFEEGREINLIKGYVVEGIYQTQQEIDDLNAAAPDGLYNQNGGNYAPGDYKFKDINGDGKITLEDDGREILGSSQADFFGGFNTSLSYKSFELSALFNFSKGGESTIASDFGFSNFLNPGVRANTIQRFNIDNRWSPTNTDASYPRIIDKGNADYENGPPGTNNSNHVYDTSFLRLKNIQLAYNFSNKLLDKMGLSAMSIFISGSNLALWTDFPGLDPEAAEGAASSFATRNSSPYPNAKSWSVGLNVNF